MIWQPSHQLAAERQRDRCLSTNVDSGTKKADVTFSIDANGDLQRFKRNANSRVRYSRKQFLKRLCESFKVLAQFFNCEVGPASAIIEQVKRIAFAEDDDGVSSLRCTHRRFLSASRCKSQIRVGEQTVAAGGDLPRHSPNLWGGGRGHSLSRLGHNSEFRRE